MNESINVENKKQIHQEPPLSPVRIIGEILVGTAMGFVVAVPVSIAIPYVLLGVLLDRPPSGEYGAFAFVVLGCALFYVFLPLYLLGSAGGVYLVGTRGKQTGSFLAALGIGILGLFIMVILFFGICTSRNGMLPIRKEKIVILGFFWSLIGPIMATIGFNLTRRYK